ncbi:bacillithiol biosynthesis cysteine-adding enzyme BshC [Litchfieldia alkalitelluris]|uniref:bacillithiol biosynthesis cysteine-adding enzyme BshC n=1 Tax=Litchfieldia alkalitelluris TaxID=304268 RepID=UPI0009984ECB|nr:bacillithiol biosynthesis cysteine-adding enzyme BshC [Litchfieldia alkalitelluris]
MEVISLSLPSTNKLVKSYTMGDIETADLFDYGIKDPDTYTKRIEDLKKRNFPRQKLVAYLKQFNEKYGFGSETFENISKLLDPSSVVVVGGQQAGLLTGPLYTIHKIISIIKLAKEQEESLGVPVVPVFWIAGEDHDFAEINHLHIKNKQTIKKKIIEQRQMERSSVSSLIIDKSVCEKWIDDIFESFGETAYTKDLIAKLQNHLNDSSTYVDFFGFVIKELFSNTGIVLLDSGSSGLREIESDFFQEMIERNELIHDSVVAAQTLLKEQGYKLSIEMPIYSANLFYHYKNERLLLEYDKNSERFTNKSSSLELTKQELLQIAKEQPSLLSNNVVTRPLMQELLLPTLAFISGPGEVAYWAELKKVFEAWEIKMPPIVPRVSITFLDRSIETDMYDVNVSIEDVLLNSVEKIKESLIKEQVNYDLDRLVAEAKNEVEQVHKRLREVALDIDSSLCPLLNKNSDYIQSQFDFISKTLEKRLLLRHQVEINRFNRIQSSLMPNNAPQERIWNIYYYLNKYGSDFINDVLELPIKVDGEHKVIKI